MAFYSSPGGPAPQQDQAYQTQPVPQPTPQPTGGSGGFPPPRNPQDQALRARKMAAMQGRKRGFVKGQPPGLLKKWLGSPGARPNPVQSGRAYAPTQANPLVGAMGGAMKMQRAGRGRGRRLGWENTRRPAQRRFQGQLAGLYEKQLKGEAGATLPQRPPSRGRDFRRGFRKPGPTPYQQPTNPQPVMDQLLGAMPTPEKERTYSTQPVAPAPTQQYELQTYQGRVG